MLEMLGMETEMSAHVYLYANNELRVGAKPHNHDSSSSVIEKKLKHLVLAIT